MFKGGRRSWRARISVLTWVLGEHASLQALRAVVPSFCPLSLGFGKLSLSSNYILLTEFLNVNAQTSEMGSGLSFAQKLAKVHSAPVPTPEGHNQAMFWFPITTYARQNKAGQYIPTLVGKILHGESTAHNI
jgi:hypothetical protein